MRRPRLRRIVTVACVSTLLLTSGDAFGATVFGPLAIVSSIPGDSSCVSVKSHYRTPPNTSATLDFNVYAFRESVPPTCNATAPFLAHQGGVMLIRAQLWTTTGVFCATTSDRIVPEGAAGSGYGWGQSWNKPSSGGCKTTQYSVYGTGFWLGVSNTSVKVFNA